MTEAVETLPEDDGIVVINGKQFMPDARGGYVPVETVRPEDKLEDEMVRKVIRFAKELSAQISRFKGHTFEDLGSFDQLLDQQYSVKRRGRKGNCTYQTHDGLLKVQVQVADLIEFGPQLQQAKAKIDECLIEWTGDSRDEIRALVLRAFRVEKEGQINKAELFALLRLDIRDERWQQAMQAIRDAIRVVGAKQYFRFYERPEPTARWQPITIDLAQA